LLVSLSRRNWIIHIFYEDNNLSRFDQIGMIIVIVGLLLYRLRLGFCYKN